MNESQSIITILDNEIDSDGWALICPYGEHPKTRVARINGRVQEQRFIQVLDNDSAAALLDSENGLFRRIKRAVVGIPVYAGHPDLKDHAPETLANREEKKQIGVVDKVRRGARGIEAHFVLSPEGATAVENDGAKYPSPLWSVQPYGERGGSILCHPVKLLSVGLTAHPNISGVESLANAGGAGQQQEKVNEMKMLTGWLIANGAAVLANCESPTEAQVLHAVQTLFTDQAGRVTTLGNEKSTQAGKITTLENEKTQLTSQVTTLTNERDTAKTRVTALENEVKTEHTARVATIVDLAITKGKLKPADRTAKITTLENSKEFDKDVKALLEGANVVRTASDTRSGKVLANEGVSTEDDPRDIFCTAVDKHMKDTGETDPVKAHKAVAKANPALADALAKRGSRMNGADSSAT